LRGILGEGGEMKLEEEKVNNQSNGVNRLTGLGYFQNDLCDYATIVQHALDGKSNKKEKDQYKKLIVSLNLRAGYLGKLIDELTELQTVGVNVKKHNMWLTALKIPADKSALSALKGCIQATIRAIGQLEDDIKKGIRDEETGELIKKVELSITETPKAFIAHEGETRSLNILKEFLDALGIQYFIAESKASDGRSIEKQVDWTESNADFAICLATKGKAINKKTGKHYMGLNIADELGRARQIYKNHIILLVQKGVEVHTNTKEIVHESFTYTNMEKAFIKICKELTYWGFLKASKLEEQIS
jgi:hypothetical protein